MKWFRVLFFASFSFAGLSNLNAQDVTLSSDSLWFGTHLKWETDSQQVYLYNNGTAALAVQDVNVYGMDFFCFGDTSAIVNAGDSLRLVAYFIPRHNIEYNGEMAVYVKDRGCFRVNLRAIGQYPGTYYSSTFNLSEEALKTALKTRLAQGYTQMGYNTARDWIFMSIDNEKLNGGGATENTLSCVYTGRQAVGYTSRADAQTNHDFNTEHTYPQSKFNSAEPMQSDMFHLFAVDEGANSRRSNHPFSMVLSPSWTEGGAKYGDSRFEPRDWQKGNSARAMLYFVTRYQNYDNFLNVNVVDANGAVVSHEALLRQWALQFPPTSTDSLRNEKIFALQKNRNPYIDHPEFLERIQFIGQNSVAPVLKSFETTIPSGTKLTFSGESGDTLYYRLCISNTGNTTLPVTVSTLHGSVIEIPASSFNVAAGESSTFDLMIIRNTQTFEQDTLVIKSSAIPGREVLVPMEINFSHVGVPETAREQLKLYPNPAQGKLFAEVALEGEYQFVLSTISGQKVISTVLNGSLNEISIEGILPGFYFVEVIQGTTQCRRTLVIR